MPMILKLGILHWVLEHNQFCSNDYPGLTLTYFTVRSNLVPYAFFYGKTVKQCSHVSDTGPMVFWFIGSLSNLQATRIGIP